MRAVRPLAVAVALLTLALGALAGCGSDQPTGACRTLCTGSIDGARYSILAPARWNGVLLLFSHGYAKDASQAHPFLTPTDTTATGVDAMSQTLLGKGYALAGSGFAQAGWNVASALTDNDRLYARFSSLVGRPTRVIAWGESLGGLITELTAERAQWVSGATSLCGVVAGPAPNADLIGRALVLTRALTGSDLRADGSEPADTLALAALSAAGRIQQLASQTDGAAAGVVATAAALGMPTRSVGTPVTDARSWAVAAAENLTGEVELGSLISADLTRRFGAGYARPDLAGIAELSAQAAGAVQQLGGDPQALIGYGRQLSGGAESGTARSALIASGTPTGRLRVPLLTVHDVDDPIALAANETVLEQTVAKAGQSARLRQTYVAPASNDPSPAYGVGHCVFSGQQWVGSVLATDQWVTSGTAPSAATLDADLGAGLDHSYRPGGWPVG